MTDAPKYFVRYDSTYPDYPYSVKQNSLFREGLAHQHMASFKTFDEALHFMAQNTYQGIVLAQSVQSVDNVFKV